VSRLSQSLLFSRFSQTRRDALFFGWNPFQLFVVTSLSYEVRHGTSGGFIGIEVYQYAGYLTHV
jgi:hypothetical protein